MRTLINLLIIFIIFSPKIFSQEIEATVYVNVEQLPQEARTYVSSMQGDLTNYLNNQKFTNIDWKGKKIPVDVTIYLSGGSKGFYSAKLLIISRRYLDVEGQSVTLKMFDEKWSFEYGLGANLTFNPNVFNAFTSLINYYMMLAIGFDLDTYGELDGSPAFDLAKNIIQLGASYGAEGYSTYTKTGEFTRYNLVSELTDPRYYLFRKLLFSYYVDGLDLIANDKDKGIAGVENVMLDMAAFKKDKMTGPSVLLQLFFDSKVTELSTLFNGYPKKEIFQALRYLDPTNSSAWNDAEEGKLR
ncbi:MAG: DUF4835 family protein [Bacteroidota bacterium]